MLETVITEIQRDPLLATAAKRNPVPDNMAEKRQWIQAMMTIREGGLQNSALFDAVEQLIISEKEPPVDAADLPNIQLSKFGPTRFAIWQGNITRLKVDAIVNAANAQMQGCFQPFHECIDNAIHNAAGPHLREECHHLINEQGHVEKIGQAKITSAYKLPSKYVLHTVGPIIHGNKPPTREEHQALANCYSACLSSAALKPDIQSIAFCGISTGVYGFPKEQAVGTAVKTTLDWLEASSFPYELIVFNTFDDLSTRLYQEEITKWL